MRCKLLVLTALFIVKPAVAVMFAERAEVRQFVEELANEHQLNKQQAIQALSKIESSPEIIQKITTPYEALPWSKYRPLFLSQQKIDGGKKFWDKYAATLATAERQFGVPAELIVAIIGVESAYGVNRGKYPVLQALATLAFDYPPRAQFFKQELVQYLLLTQEQKLDPLEIKGSYAGAMGSPQFIASSYRKFAVDFDNSGKIDLSNNIIQAIGSVANYFKMHGWQTNQPVVLPAKAKRSAYLENILKRNNDPRPTLSLSTLKQNGITPLKSLNGEQNVTLLEFDDGKNKEYWLGLSNFYVITRYNHSSNYAMAVYQLSQAIKHARG